jgi:predicted nucleic acid-binding protein
MLVVVSDTSPIRALAHLDHLSVLEDLFDRVLAPPAVERELRAPPARLSVVRLEEFPFVHVQAPEDGAKVQELLETLDLGESEALALAVETQASAILIDEAAGRARATELGLTVIGTLGVLLRCKTRGRIASIKPLLDRLEDELSFYISPALRQDVLRRAGE